MCVCVCVCYVCVRAHSRVTCECFVLARVACVCMCACVCVCINTSKNRWIGVIDARSGALKWYASSSSYDIHVCIGRSDPDPEYLDASIDILGRYRAFSGGRTGDRFRRSVRSGRAPERKQVAVQWGGGSEGWRSPNSSLGSIPTVQT